MDCPQLSGIDERLMLIEEDEKMNLLREVRSRNYLSDRRENTQELENSKGAHVPHVPMYR